MIEARITSAVGEEINSGILHLGGELTVVSVSRDPFDNCCIAVIGDEPILTVNGQKYMLTNVEKENR